MFDDRGLGQAFGAYNFANLAHNMQGNYLGGMANDINGAIANEMQSRVAQQREANRMEHESSIANQQLQLQRERLANERARQQDDAANQIRMLKFQSAQNDKAMGRPGRKEYRQDPTTGQFRWFDEWEM